MVMIMPSDFLIAAAFSEPNVEKGKWSIPDKMARDFVYAVEHGCSIDVGLGIFRKQADLSGKTMQEYIKKLLSNPIVRQSKTCRYILENI